MAVHGSSSPIMPSSRREPPKPRPRRQYSYPSTTPKPAAGLRAFGQAARDSFGGQGATVAKRFADRARAFAASTSRFFGGAVETSSFSRCCVACATSFTARWKAASLAFDGFDIPAIFRTYCRAASCTSAELAGGSKLFKGLMFRHILPFCPTQPMPPLDQLGGASSRVNFGAAAPFVLLGLTRPNRTSPSEPTQCA